jgi:Hint domain/Bacterial Ig-like domain
MPSATIGGFTTGNQIDLASIEFDSGGSAQLESGNLLHINENGANYYLQLDPTQQSMGGYFKLSDDGSGGTEITANTLIYTEIGFPFGPSTFGLFGLNDAGEIVGDYYGSSDGLVHGFIYGDGNLINMPDYPGANSTQPLAISDSGEIVGYYYNAVTAGGFTYTGGANGTYTEFGNPSDPNTVYIPRGINNAGHIVGWTGGSFTQGFFYDGSNYTTLNDPVGAGGTYALGINDADKIVGYYNSGGQEHGFIYSRGTYTSLDVPDAADTQPLDINDKGDVVGYYVAMDGASHGFLYTGGEFFTLNPPGALPGAFGGTSEAWGINNSNQIVGYGYGGQPTQYPQYFIYFASPLQQLSGQLALTSVTEGATTTGQVATFTDADLTDTSNSTHFYADEGADTVTVAITRTADGMQIAPTGTVTVADAALSAIGTTITGTEGAAISNATVATFTDGNPHATASDFTATIDWGDGTSTSGTVVAQNGGGFAVDGGHSYAEDGQYSGQATINDAGGSTASASFAVAVDPSAPVITTLVGQHGSAIEAQGTGEAGDTITLYADSDTTLVGTGTVAADGNFDITTSTTFADGWHTLTATQSDAVGLTSTASASFPVLVMPTYSYTTLIDPTAVAGGDYLVVGYDQARSINSSGQVVGNYYNGTSYHYQAFIYSNGIYTNLIDPSQGPNGQTYAFSINDSGQVVGTYYGPSGQGAFIYSNSTYTNLFDPLSSNGGTLGAQSINSSGQVVGYCFGPNESEEGFLYSNGIYTNLIDPSQGPLFGTIPTSINSSGQVVGVYEPNGSSEESFLYSDGVYTDLIDPSQGSNGSTSAQSINDSGQVVGSYYNGTSWEGFLYSNGIYTDLIDPSQGSNGSTYAGSINDSGQVVGSYYNSTSYGGFLYSNGIYTDFINLSPQSINDAGQIVGSYTIGGTSYGFLASPLPLSGQLVLTSVTEGMATTEPVVTFSDPNITDTASSFAATVNWGDGTTETGTVTGANGSFAIAVPGSTHFYADESTDSATVTITRTVDDAQLVLTGTVTVTDAPLSATGTTVSGTEGVAISNATVATFTDANVRATASNFTATIDWGDGTSTSGTVVAQNGGGFAVDGGHTYAEDGQYSGQATINEVGGSTASTGFAVAANPTAPVITTTLVLQPAMAIEVKGTGAVGNSVALYADAGTTPVGTGRIAANGSFDIITWVTFAGGSHTLTATQTDAQGLTSTISTSAEVDTPCYCAGTLILTDRGEVAVEMLAIGDNVITADGSIRLIRWIGRRSYAGRFARGSHVLPICIKAGALDVDQPRRDLWISPHHAMFLDGVLIEAIDLVNGVSIVQADRVERIDYFHIELDTHDIIVAEGALSESFVDDDSRAMFQNAHEFKGLYPDVPTVPARYCAPRLAFGAEVEAAKQRIAHRAGILYVRPPAANTLRALVIDSRCPEVGHDGGSNAILDHMRALQAAGFQVSFLALHRDGMNTRALSSLGVTMLSLPASGRVSEVMRAHAGQFDLVYLHRVERAMHCLKLARQYFDAQIVYSVADLHHLRLKAQSRIDQEHAFELIQEAQMLALQELTAALAADCVITHSVSEAAQLEQLKTIADARKVRVVPWTVPVAPVHRPFADRSGVAFIGGFAHAPNVDAARWR